MFGTFLFDYLPWSIVAGSIFIVVITFFVYPNLLSQALSCFGKLYVYPGPLPQALLSGLFFVCRNPDALPQALFL